MLMSENKVEEVFLEDLEEEILEEPKKVRFGRLPDWKFMGWQFTFFFGKIADPNVPLLLQNGWKTIIVGVFKVKELPKEDWEIKSENIQGAILQGQVWLPFDQFWKL